MKQELSKQLRETYKELFADECELSIGDGWYDIINELSRSIMQHLKNLTSQYEWERKKGNPNGVSLPELIRYQQIKEKFGSLRVYCNYSDDYVDGMISMAETISGRICEECGNKGEIRNISGWYSCKCNQHFMATSLNAPDDFMN